MTESKIEKGRLDTISKAKTTKEAATEYERIKHLAWEEYKSVRERARQTVHPFSEEYEKIRERAFAEYERVVNSAWQEYMKRKEELETEKNTGRKS